MTLKRLAAPFVALMLTAVVGSLAQAEEMGAGVYLKKCVQCHGRDARGDTKMGKYIAVPDLTVASNWSHGTSEAAVQTTIRFGHGRMPRWGDRMSFHEISAVARFIRKLTGVDPY